MEALQFSHTTLANPFTTLCRQTPRNKDSKRPTVFKSPPSTENKGPSGVRELGEVRAEKLKLYSPSDFKCALLRFVSCGRVTKETESETASRKLAPETDDYLTRHYLFFSFFLVNSGTGSRVGDARPLHSACFFNVTRCDLRHDPPPHSLRGLMRDRLRIAQGIHRRDDSPPSSEHLACTPRTTRVRAHARS